MTGIEAIIAATATALGVTTTTAAAILGIAVSLLTSALQMGLSALNASGEAAGEQRGQLQSTIRDPVKAREIVFGKVRKGGTVLFTDSINNDAVLLMVVAFAGHEVAAIDEIYFFDEIAIEQDGTIRPKYKNHLAFEKFLGTDSQPSSTILRNLAPQWTAQHQLKGIAYIVLKLVFDQNIYNTIPNATAVIRGAKIFDSRDSVTRYTTNTALAMAYYLNHPVYGLKATYGTDIDTTLLNAAANVCDEDVPIKAGKVLEFDGNDDLVRCNDVLDQTGSLTVEAMVYPGSITKTGMQVIDKDSGTQGWSLQIDTSKVRFITRGLSNVTLDTSTGQMAVAAWKRISAVYDAVAGTKTIEVDGVVVASVSGITGTLSANATGLRIGDKFKGRLLDVRLWNDPRTHTEINAFKAKTLQGTESNLAGYWKLDEKQGKIAEDAVETPNDGKIDGAKWVDDESVLLTSKRYPCNGVIFSDQLPREVVADLVTGMAGSIVYSGGTWLIRAGAFQSPTVTLDENDLRDSLRIQPARSRRELFNSVRGTFAAPENGYQQSDFPPVTNSGFEAQDGGERITQDIQLPMTTSPSIAQRIAWLHLLRNREQLSCSMKCKLGKAFRLRAGDTVAVDNTRMGWDGKSFEVINWKLVQVDDSDGNPGIGVDLELRELSAPVFDFNPATDEVPLNASPNTRLPSPFGQLAIVSALIERSGFTTIEEQEHAFNWPGTIVGMVPNPMTGCLNVEDQIDASGNDFNVFDQYVQVPVVSAYYETLEVDIEFDDLVRTFVEYAMDKGGGETGAFGFEVLADARLDGAAYDGYQGISSTILLEGRYLKHRIDFDFSQGWGGFIGSFNVVIDKTTVFLVGADVIIPVGGKSFDFAQQFHNMPSMGWSCRQAARIATFTDIQKTGFTAVVFDNAAADVGGTIGWQATGV